MESKKCNDCELIKPYSGFHKNKRNPDGYKYTCKECRVKESLSYASKNRELIAVKTRKWRLNNLEKDREAHKIYRLNNLEDLSEKARIRKKNRRNSDLIFKMRDRVSRYLRRTLTGESACKQGSTLYPIVGLTGSELIIHLHASFELYYGLPRECINLRDVEIDHIIPLYTAQTVSDVHRLNHYSNLQLLFKEDNQAKGTKIPLDLPTNIV
jgi:hypothetical protein